MLASSLWYFSIVAGMTGVLTYTVVAPSEDNICRTAEEQREQDEKMLNNPESVSALDAAVSVLDMVLKVLLVGFVFAIWVAALVWAGRSLQNQTQADWKTTHERIVFMMSEYSALAFAFVSIMVCKFVTWSYTMQYDGQPRYIAGKLSHTSFNNERAFFFEFDKNVIPAHEKANGSGTEFRPSFWIGVVYWISELARCVYVTLWEFGTLYGGDAANPYTIPTQNWNYMDVVSRWAIMACLTIVMIANAKADDRSFVVINEYNVPLICVPVPLQVGQVALDLSTMAIYYLDRERFYVYVVLCVMLPAIFTAFQQTWAAFPYFSIVCKTVFWTIASLFYATVTNGASNPGTNLMTPDTGYVKYFPLTTWQSRIATYTEHTIPMALYFFSYTAMFIAGLSFIAAVVVVLYDGQDSVMGVGSSFANLFGRAANKVGLVVPEDYRQVRKD
jgi:hypothetical protein